MLGPAQYNQLPEHIGRPYYDRKKLTPGIVHIGLGNFHRAHQAYYLHKLMQKGEALDWAIIGASVRDGDRQMRDKLLRQEFLTTLIKLDPEGVSAEVTGAMIDYLPIEEDNKTLIKTMAQPEIRIVSLTITEGGYYTDRSTGGFDDGHLDIQHDAQNPMRPKTAFGAIVAALRLRRDQGTGLFTVLSCDNLQGNGNITRNAVVSLARLNDPSLARWIEQNGAFPNSMVDCIVPATGLEEILMVQQLGIDDAVPVTHEDYRAWVIEGQFCAGRPPWEKAGAVLTDSVHDYETMKIRILNAGHQVIANAGELRSIKTIAECMNDPLISAFFTKVQHEEIAPYVKPVPGIKPGDYVTLVRSRFSNPAIKDTTRRVAFDGSSRHPGFVLPILRDAIKANGPIDGLSLVEALWARMCAGTREDGSKIEPNDPDWDNLQNAAQEASKQPIRWLEQRQYYGDLASHTPFRDSFERWLKLIWEQGSKTAIEIFLKA